MSYSKLVFLLLTNLLSISCRHIPIVKRSCNRFCVVANSILYERMCLTPVKCQGKVMLLLPNMVLNNNYVIDNNQLYQSYQTIPGTTSCIVSGSVYHPSSGKCIKATPCSHSNKDGVPVFMQDGNISRNYYVMKFKLYKIYRPICV